MAKRRTIGGGALKAGYGYSSFGAHDEFRELVDTPSSYAGQAGKVVVVKGTEDGLEFNTEAAIDRHDVKVSSIDVNPQFLEDKVVPGVGLYTTKSLLDDTLIFNCEMDPATAWANKVLSFYDPTGGLPGVPSAGDRYISTATANGWYVNYIYEYNGSTWVGTLPSNGLTTYDQTTKLHYSYNGSAWVAIPSINAMTAKPSPAAADLVMIEDSADSYNKKKSTLAQVMSSYSFAFSRGANLYIPTGITATVNLVVWRAPYACTVTNVHGYRVGGTGASVNGRRSVTDYFLASNLSLASTDTWLTGAAPQNTAIAAGGKIEVTLETVAGSPTQIIIQVDLVRTL